MILLIQTLIFIISPVQAKGTPYLLTRYIAKEYCSCRYVVEQSPKICKNENKAYKALFKVSEDSTNKVITVKNLAAQAKAQFISTEEGCILLKD